MANNEVVKYEVIIQSGQLPTSETEIDHSQFIYTFKDACIWAVMHLKETGQIAVVRAICFTEWAQAGIGWETEVWTAVRTERNGIQVVAGTKQMPLGY